MSVARKSRCRLTRRRGEVWLESFDPSVDGEVQKSRPAVVVSDDTANALLNRVQVLLLSSQVGRLYRAEAFFSVEGNRRKAMADQVTTAGKERLLRRLGALSREDLDAVPKALCVQLALEPGSGAG